MRTRPCRWAAAPGTFRVVAAEDIATLDGTVRYTAGQVVDTIECDEEGYGESQELYLGTYTVQQATSPDYYATMEEDLTGRSAPGPRGRGGKDPAGGAGLG